MQVIIYQANAFSEEPIEGNRAGVIPDFTGYSEEDIQKILKLLNLEKTAFTYKIDDSNYRVRIFNRKDEIEFCSSTTIATFYTLGEKGYIDGIKDGTIRVHQHTNLGINPIDIFYKNWEIVDVELGKIRPEIVKEYIDVDAFSNVLNIDKESISLLGESICPCLIFSGNNYVVVPVKDENTLKTISIDVDKLKEILKPMLKPDEGFPPIHIFTLNENKDISCRQFEIKEEALIESECNETSSIAFAYFLDRRGLLSCNREHCGQNNFTDSICKAHLRIASLEDDYPIKIGGVGKVFFEGIIKL